MLYAEIKQAYKKAETWKDADELLNRLDKQQLKDWIDCHEKVKFLTGLDMKQEFYLECVKAIYKVKFAKKED
jgi:poly-beta-hydroxyalkanoate depolymerase